MNASLATYWALKRERDDEDFLPYGRCAPDCDYVRRYFTSIAARALVAAADPVLMAVSSHGVDGGKTRPGLEMGELAQVYLMFKANGLKVDIASPKGGQPGAYEFNVTKAYNAAFLADAEAGTKLAKTLPLSGVNEKEYNAIFVGLRGPQRERQMNRRS